MANVYMMDVVPADGTPRIRRQPFLVDGYLDQLAIRLYPGQQKELELYVRIKQYGGSMVDVVAGNPGSWIVGDDDTLRFSSGIFVRRGEVLEVTARNIATVPSGSTPEDYRYTYQVILSIQEGSAI